MARSLTPVLAALASGALAVCASAPAAAQLKSVAEVANYAGPDRQKILEDGARREGSIMLYATGTQIQPLLDRFKQKYPFIKVEMPRASSADTARQIYEEYSAGVYNVDAFELSSYGLVPIRDMGFLQPFKTPEAANYVDSALEPGGRWISVREGYIGIGFNTKVIPEKDAPKSYQDLLDPKWKGKMAISSSASTASNWVGAMLVTHGTRAIAAFVRL